MLLTSPLQLCGNVLNPRILLKAVRVTRAIGGVGVFRTSRIHVRMLPLSQRVEHAT